MPVRRIYASAMSSCKIFNPSFFHFICSPFELFIILLYRHNCLYSNTIDKKCFLSNISTSLATWTIFQCLFLKSGVGVWILYFQKRHQEVAIAAYSINNCRESLSGNTKDRICSYPFINALALFRSIFQPVLQSPNTPIPKSKIK